MQSITRPAPTIASLRAQQARLNVRIIEAARVAKAAARRLDSLRAEYALIADEIRTLEQRP